MSPDTSDRDIVNSRTYPHPREQVFAAFSDPDSLAQWWGPKGFTNTFHAFDFQPGGQWLFTMHSPDGHDFKNECVFQESSAPGRIRIYHIPPPKYLLEVILDPTAEGTRLSWVQTFETAEMRDKIFKFAGPANEELLDRLADVLASKP